MRDASIAPMRVKLALVALLLCCPALATDRAEREFQECPDCPTMIGIRAGSFTMGSPAHEPGRFDAEGPQHRVAIKAFALAKYDVTSAEFLAFLRATGYQPKPCNALLNFGWRSPGNGIAYAPSPSQIEPPRWPAVWLDWSDAEAYIAWINQTAHEAR